MSSAYITLITKELYLPGVLSLSKALKSFDKNHPLAILYDSSALSEHLIELIKDNFDDLIDIKDDLIVSDASKVNELLGRPELAITFSKILLWSLYEKYTKLVYLDADTLPVQSLEHLFDAYSPDDKEIVASPDAGWPDIFNSGVIILKPSKQVFDELSQFAVSQESFDGADQGLLNEYFTAEGSSKKKGSWKRLPFTYNVTPNASYQYTPAFKRFSKDIKIVHFIGAVKPWHSNVSSLNLEHQQLWWDHFNSHFSSQLAAKILSKKGEGHSLLFANIENVWADESSGTKITEDLESLSVEEDSIPAIFPWEKREAKLPFRVFES